jgi:hypothetical protein
MTANDPIGCRDFVPHSIHLHATFCGTDSEKELMRFFLILPSKELDSFQKNMRILSLQKSDGIGECPLTCENFFKLL